MTKQQVVAEYLAGRIDRREFVRRLTAVGLSAAAAVAYAEALGQSAAARSAGPNEKGFITAFQGTADYPVTDTDADGFTDAEEEACGSDPNDPNSVCGDADGGFGTSKQTIVSTTDISFNLPGGQALMVSAGQVITVGVGTPASDGLRVPMTFTGTVNGLAASFTATLLVSSRTALQIGSVRAQPVGSSVTVVVQKLADWKVVDMDQPSTPFNITISGSGSVLTVEISGAKTTVAVTREANGKMWIAALNALPNTGAGTDGTSDGRWLAPLAVAGAGFAAIARRVRKHSRSS